MNSSSSRYWPFYGLFMILAITAPFATSIADKVQAAGNVRAGAWFVCIVGLTGVLTMLGLRSRGNPLGVLIDGRNRYSLSRLQMTLWSILVLATLYTVLISNALLGTANTPPSMKVNIQWELIALMGLSVASFVGSPLALSVKAERSPNEAEVSNTAASLQDDEKLAEGAVRANGVLIHKTRSKDARLSDLIKGEETGNAAEFDLPRIQMLAITVIVIGSYAIDLFHMMINRGLKFVDNKFTYDPYSWVIETFPPIDDTLLVLVLVSHGGYLTGKLIPRSRSVGKGVSMKLGRAMQLSQKVGNLLRSFEQSLNIDNLLPRDRDHLQNLNINAKSLASKIEALPGRIGAGETVDDDLARLEGQIDALDTSYRSIVSSETLPIGANDATPEVVIEVQKQLKDRDYPVETTGILDDATRLAVEGFIKKQGLSKGDLHSEEYRRYEEILSLL